MSGQYCVYLFAFSVLFNEASDALIGKNVQLAEKSEFPFIVSLVNSCNVIGKENHICGGSLISRKHVLTAAHCLTEVYESCVWIIAGTIDFESGQIREIENWITYDEWVIKKKLPSKPTDNDVAIITLSQEVHNIDPGVISHLKMSEVIEEREVITAGWGFTTRDVSIGTRPKSLQKGDLNVLTREESACNEKELFGKVMPIKPNMYSTSANPPLLLSYRDCGGPLLLRRNNEIVGVNKATSHVHEKDKNPHSQSLHIAVDYYRDFIESVIKGGESKSSGCSIS